MARNLLDKELDLRLQSIVTVGERMSSLPGYRTSATFLSFLRANLVLLPSAPNSTTSTPLLDASSSQTLPPLRPSSLATMTSNHDDNDIDDAELLPLPSQPANPLDNVPPLTTTVLTSEEDKIEALKLVADSIAQQRQSASRAVIFHPLTMAIYIVLVGLVYQLLYKSRSDLGVLATTLAGVTMACLVGVRSMTGGYLTLAEKLNWSFVTNSETGEEDIIIASRFGAEIIGTAIVRLEGNGYAGRNGSAGRKKTKNGKTGGKGLVRAWTVKLRYRRKGVGTELLEEVIRVCRDRLGKEVEIGFAVEHANSQMILPEFLNGGFRRSEIKAAKALDTVLESSDGGKWKKR